MTSSSIFPSLVWTIQTSVGGNWPTPLCLSLLISFFIMVMNAGSFPKLQSQPDSDKYEAKGHIMIKPLTDQWEKMAMIDLRTQQVKYSTKLRQVRAMGRPLQEMREACQDAQFCFITVEPFAQGTANAPCLRVGHFPAPIGWFSRKQFSETLLPKFIYATFFFLLLDNDQPGVPSGLRLNKTLYDNNHPLLFPILEMKKQIQRSKTSGPSHRSSQQEIWDSKPRFLALDSGLFLKGQHSRKERASAWAPNPVPLIGSFVSLCISLGLSAYHLHSSSK